MTFIDKLAFADCPNLRSVSFPTTLQDIEDSFVNCNKLANVDLSTAVQLQCLSGCFKGCTGLTTVTLPENLEEIGEGTFEDCANLAHLKYDRVKPPVRFIGANAFKGTSVDRTPLLNKVEYIGPNAFDTGKPLLWDFGENSWIDDPLRFGEDLFSIYPEATGVLSDHKLSLNPVIEGLDEKIFSSLPWKNEVQILLLSPKIQTLEILGGLKGLQAFDVPKGYRLSNVLSSIFDECPNLNPETIISLIKQDGVFHTVPVQDKTIQSALILYGVQVLSSKTFQDCKKLTTVRLPDSLETIKSRAFECCTALQEIEFPSNLSLIEDQAFFDCPCLSLLCGTHKITQINEAAFENCPELGVIKIFAPDDQKVVSGPVDTNVQTAIVLQGTESIGGSAFYNCTSLAFITLPPSLQSIGNYAFYGCSKLVEIDVSKVMSSVTDAISWSSVFYNQSDRNRVTKVICRREQADKMREVFTKATFTYVD